jgi:hypothetical protein
MRLWTRRSLVRISGHWFVMVSFAAGVVETALLHTWLWPPNRTYSSSGSEISLQILPKGSRLLVQWNPRSLAVLQGYSGLLTVQDGGRQVRVPLDRRQLRTGTTSYTPTSEWAEFRLEIYRDGNHYFGEAMALATGLKAKENAVRMDTVLVHEVPRPNSKALPLPLSAASSGLERLEARPSGGYTISPGVEEPQLRELARSTLLSATNTRTPAFVEESPPGINPAQNKTALPFRVGHPEQPSPKGDSGRLQEVAQPDFAVLPLPLSAASSDRSERLEARPSPGSTIPPRAEDPQLRELAQPTLFAATNSSGPAFVDEIPASINSAQNRTAVIFPVNSKQSPVAEVPLNGSKVGKLSVRTYDGIILDAACDTLTDAGAPDEPHKHCAVSAATAMFAIRLENGQTLRFDSVGNLRAQNAKLKNQWVAKTFAGKKIHAKVTGAIAGDDLIVLSIE